MRLFKIDDLRPGMMIAQDLYSGANRYIPLVRKHSILNEITIMELKNKGVKAIYILDRAEWPRSIHPEDDLPIRNAYVPRPNITVDIKLKDEALLSIEKVFTATYLSGANIFTPSAQVIKQLGVVVEQLVASLEMDPSALVNISDLKSYDEYTFHHSLCVTVLSLAIAQQLSFNTEMLRRIGMCAIMHDIGKTAVPIEITLKPTKLDTSEFTIMQFHSVAGYNYLLKSDMKDTDILQGVLHHHEKFDGTGYPDRLSGYDIPLWSRIISIADVYDALTSDRPYRKPLQPGEAVEYVMGGVGSLFDFETVSAFVSKLELYPLGSKLELSDGRIGVVINNQNQLRPVVRDINTGVILDLFRDRSCLSIVVKRLINENVDVSTKLNYSQTT